MSLLSPENTEIIKNLAIIIGLVTAPLSSILLVKIFNKWRFTNTYKEAATLHFVIIIILWLSNILSLLISLYGTTEYARLRTLLMQIGILLITIYYLFYDEIRGSN